MRLAVYGCVSSILAIGVVLSAMHQRSNFYAACIYLSKSSACMMILLNMGLIISVLFGKALQAIFFGRLRAIEVEHLYERSWYAATETCLAMTIFREEFDLQFIVVFTTLLFLKIFHWLCQDRVEFMEQSPANRVTFHVRMVNLLAILLLVDSLLANHAIHVTLTKGPNMMIMFGFEYTILICSILSTIGKYILNVIDMRTEQTWEGKSMYVFYLDLVTDFFKLITYLVFFLYICLNYQLPLHIIRDVYVTFRSFIQKCRDLYRYRRATRNMNELYPNATAEDLSRSSDSTCIICREEMQIVDTTMDEDNPEAAAYRGDNEQNLDQPKKLPCGHIFHFHCLRSWLERQQTCPTCRRSVLNETNNQSQAQPPDQAQQPPQPPQAPLQPPQQPFAQSLFNQLPIPSGPAHQTNPSSSLNILMPSNQPSNIPGLIPLVPLNTQHYQQSQQNGNSLPINLSEEDLRILATTTREALEQRLRVLTSVDEQISDTIIKLTRVLSVMPVETPSQEQPQQQQQTSQEAAGAVSQDEVVAPDTTSENGNQSGEQQQDMSDRRREKMPDYSASSQVEQE
ncbi:hypothetical protein HMPREF1544_09744 [Mucor circinelloides 1006PhL]|uniref:RING-type E3 ubiquitin transferase n=1 Tax=Mucor circinelloides f. circinelloides (strain 1006PhL) TaxID=1220926 RepID=S2JLU0_MUCC1|nr:hypothetical protein HMPREF1544_09744 [Mucor circinelloides 1006PhL]